MSKKSAGILLFQKVKDNIKVFLVHPGGPFYRKKDDGCWSIPKGEFSDEEEGLSAAIREFQEETGHQIKGNFVELDPIKLPSRKIVHAWAVEGHIPSENITSNTFELEWPPKSGKIQEFPEVDRAEWFSIVEAKKKMNKGQVNLLEQLASMVGIEIADNNIDDIESDLESKDDSQISLFD